ncbi:MAG: histidinol-phosphate transaminase [Bacillota bacterium]
MIQPRVTVAGLTPYVPGKPLQEARRELGLTDVIKLASNENPLGPSPRAVEAMKQVLGETAFYPDSANRELQGLLADRLGLEFQQVLVGNGSDELFHLVAEAYLEPGLEALVPTPSFSVYTSVTRLAGAQPVPVPLKQGAPDLEATLAAVGPGTRVVFLCSPNNPTGGILKAVELRRFLDLLPAGILVVLDEAYGDYADDPDYPDSLPWIREGRPLLVTRTFSKLYGLAGVRLGFGLAPAAILAPLRLIRDPFSVNALAQAAGPAALADGDHRRRSLAMNTAGRALLYDGLNRLGLGAEPTQANFVLVHLPMTAREAFQGLLERGVIVRPADSFGLPRSIRVTIGTPPQVERFLDAIRGVLDQGCGAG